MSSVRIWVYLAALLALVALGLAWRLRHAPNELATYIAGRGFILTEQARVAPKGMTLIVGDSIVERAWHPEVCGAAAFNAGISSAALRDLAPLATTLVPILQPSRIILAIGTNDAAVGRAVPTEEWIGAYGQLLDALPKDRVELVAAPAVEPGKLASGLIDSADLAAKNRALRALAIRRGVAFAPSIAIATGDGLHPTAAGAAAWRANVELHCPRASGRKDRP